MMHVDGQGLQLTGASARFSCNDTQLESWSMGKSLAATLFALLVKDGTCSLEQPAPAWKRPEYGGFFWLNRVGTWNLPPETYFAAGAGGQNTWIVPLHDLVIVRMGHMRGQGPARRATNTALGLVMEAIGGKPGEIDLPTAESRRFGPLSEWRRAPLPSW